MTPAIHVTGRKWLVFSTLLATSCVQVDPGPDFQEARKLVEETTGRQEVFDPLAPVLSNEEIDAVLADGLSLDEAMRLALVNNRELQADFQEIGVAHADWVQSRLLSNPSLDVLLRFPIDGGASTLEALLGVELLEIWRIPIRTEAASRDLEATVLRIARRAGERLAEARRTYYEAVAADELYGVAQENVELARRSFEAVKDLHEAGAADAFDENLSQGPLLAAQLALRTARIEMANAKRDLGKILSIDGPVEALELTDRLPDPVSAEVDTEALVQEALISRLDLRALSAAIDALDARVRLERRKAWGELSAGPEFQEEGSPSGGDVVGPGIGLTLPIFDQNQAQVARAEFRLQQMVKLREAAQVAVAQDVRASADRVSTSARNLAFYGEELLPQAERSLDLARQSYAAGRTTLLALIETQRQVLEARRGYVTLRLEAAMSATELERDVGAPLHSLP